MPEVWPPNSTPSIAWTVKPCAVSASVIELPTVCACGRSTWPSPDVRKLCFTRRINPDEKLSLFFLEDLLIPHVLNKVDQQRLLDEVLITSLQQLHGMIKLVMDTM